MKPLIFTLPLLLLSACASRPAEPEPIIRTVTIEVPVFTSCVPDSLDRRPIYPDTDDALRLAADAAERMLLMFEGRISRNARLEALETVIDNCQTEIR